MSKLALLEKLTDKAYRDAFVSDEIDVGLPIQLRSMREKRGWKQSYVAEQTGTKQPRITLMEKAGYGNFSLNTLKKMASLFDVGLVVSFVPWSEMIDFTEAISNKRLAIPRFVDDYVALERRYSRAVRASANTSQATFDFTSTSEAVSPKPTATTEAPVLVVEGTGDEEVITSLYMAYPITEGIVAYVGTGTSPSNYTASR